LAKNVDKTVDKSGLWIKWIFSNCENFVKIWPKKCKMDKSFIQMDKMKNGFIHEKSPILKGFRAFWING